MYSPRSYGSPPPELSNNPFIDHPANALTRYPDISGGDDFSDPSSSHYTAWLQRPSGFVQNSTPPAMYADQGFSPGYGGAYQQQQQQPQPLQPQQTAYGGGMGYMSSPQGYGAPVQSPTMTGRPGFQPASSFGQQLSAQVNGPGAYAGLPQQQPQYTGYSAQTPSQFGGAYTPGYAPQPTGQYFPEFDPYAQQQQQQQTALGGSQYRPPHPREYVRDHKAELETWDGYSWKQVQNSFDALKEAWTVRKREIEARARSLGGAGVFGAGGYPGMYGGQAQEVARLESLAKEADSNHDSVAASSFQMHEVYTGYRQSGDIASKRRVREAINAALNSLPDWPPQSF
ncbi:hypothetical protein WOLCODRAFT_143906 [Wolfiporia cocos MD-104 SS10]|uniref:Uncharacterized protein n=1 Tax=Wolfiporia cocos (strain MD-104) TaxID=742152 RepID=A0A2H3JZJ7_WOLCO|nr:hypothetical protein WOLCODRAFT_143906 [Wolfiporia cocos MD-104 SS10]